MNLRKVVFFIILTLEKTPKRLENVLYRNLLKVKDRSDRAFVKKVVYVVFRNRLLIDYILKKVVKSPLEKLNLKVITILRLGLGEVLAMSTPTHAVVYETVELAKVASVVWAKGFINAVLRNSIRNWKELVKVEKLSLKDFFSLKYSHPIFFVKRFFQYYSAKEIEAWLKVNQKDSAFTIRVNFLKSNVEQVFGLLKSEVFKITKNFIHYGSFDLVGIKKSIQNLPGFKDGFWQIQDAGASLVSRLLKVGPNMRVLDLCAGAGGKTGYVADLMKNKGELWAVEPSVGRMRGLKKNLKRLDVKCVKVIQEDGTALTSNKMGFFDRILVDVPCTGSGVIGRRPDIRWRFNFFDIKNLISLQKKLCTVGFKLLKPGGFLVYATCSVMREENEEVVKYVLQTFSNCRLDKINDDKGYYSKILATEKEFFFRTRPFLHNCDSFFCARFVKLR